MKNRVTLTFFLIVVLLTLLNSSYLFMRDAYAQINFIVKINQKVFVPGDTIVIYGKGYPNDSLFVRIFDPSGKTIKFESIPTDEKGLFTKQIFVWPQPDKNLVFGQYSIEVLSSRVGSFKDTLIISFTGSTEAIPPSPHILSVKLDSPTQVSTESPFRIFVQVTFDGALVNFEPDELVSALGSSHIHSGDKTINLSGKFIKLHEGLYYADVNLNEEGTYIIHSIVFYKGFLAHDSKVVSSGSSFGDIQYAVDNLKTELNKTSKELNDTRYAVTKEVEGARAAIKEDIDQARTAVDELTQASGQINSIILPILALISVIIALQISLFARIRASFK